VRLYVIGAEGQVARSLREAAAGTKELVVECGARPNVDVLRADLVEKALAAFLPDIVINPAAYTAVDRAEAEPKLAFAVNCEGAGVVAAAAARQGVPIVHLSTDYVFDGKKQGRYVETDATAPLGVYGRSKYEGERAVAAANHRHIILRTSWIYAPFGNNFLRTMLRLSADRNTLAVVDDQLGCPTYAPDVADSIFAIARMIQAKGWQQRFAGVTHLAGPEEATWFSFARRIFKMAKKRGHRDVAVEPISTIDFPTAAARPANSRLCCDRLDSTFGIRLPALDLSLENCLERILGTQSK
jgi:dTDP-4-dehydrorhamnose reductase